MKGGGTQQDPYLVSTPEDLMNVSGSAHYLQTNNIDLIDYADYNNSSGFPQISTFSGIYDGGNYHIKNLYMNDSTGLFGSITSGGLKNIILSNPYVTSISNSNIGTLVQQLDGDGIFIENCHSNGYVSSSGITSHFTGLGGLIGSVLTGNASIIKCTSSSNVVNNSTRGSVGGLIGRILCGSTINIEECSTSGNVEGNGIIGGIIGRFFSNGTAYLVKSKSSSNVTNNSTNVTGGIVGVFSRSNDSDLYMYDCYTTGGIIQGKRRVGGIVGSYDGSGMKRVYSSAEKIIGNEDVGGIIGSFGDDVLTNSIDGCFALCNEIKRNEGNDNSFGRISGSSHSGLTNNFAIDTLIFIDENGNEDIDFWDLTQSKNGNSVTDQETRQRQIYENAGWLFN